MLQPRVDAFIDYLAQVRGYSLHSVASYQRQLNAVVGDLESLGTSQWAQLNVTTVEQLVLLWRRKRAGIATIQQRLSALRSLCQELIRQGELTSNPAALVQAPKAGKRLPRNLDIDSMMRLLDIDPSDDLALRDRAMFELFYSSGLRLSELVSLNVTDLGQDRELRVLGKGKKTRIVPVGKEAERWLNLWLKARSQWAGANTPALFLSKKQSRISERSVQQRLKKWGLLQGIADNV